jgi:hypothetical protein
MNDVTRLQKKAPSSGLVSSTGRRRLMEEQGGTSPVPLHSPTASACSDEPFSRRALLD